LNRFQQRSRTPLLSPVSGLRGLGFVPPDPSVGDSTGATDQQLDDILYNQDPNDAAAKIDSLLKSLGIGSGRAEADVIVPVQNRLMTNLDAITAQILTGQHPSVSTLMGLYSTVVTLANNFVAFVLSQRFTDRRASGQALNTVMPYINGTCGYQVPVGFTPYPTQYNCISWGDGTIGGVGSDGMLGAISRAIGLAGGLPPNPGGGGGVILNPTLPNPGGTTTFGFSTPVAVGLGILAIYYFSKRRA